MATLICAACIAFGNPEGGNAAEAETIYDGNALCMNHVEIGFTFEPLRRHRQS